MKEINEGKFRDLLRSTENKLKEITKETKSESIRDERDLQQLKNYLNTEYGIILALKLKDEGFTMNDLSPELCSIMDHSQDQFISTYIVKFMR